MKLPIMMVAIFRGGFALCVGLSLTACTSLLPTSTQETKTPWRTYADAEAMYAKIIPAKTTLPELKTMGIDPEKTANVALLSHADLLHRLVAMKDFGASMLDPALAECVASRQACFAYELEQTVIDRKHYGNFWMDFMNFRQQIEVTGWQFNAIILISNDMVIYKLWSGKPMIKRTEEERNPLGPLQGIGPSIFRR